MRREDLKPIRSDVAMRHLAVVTPLRVQALDVPLIPQRRRMPRRQVALNVAIERRSVDRRQRRPGVDGLLRTVLADEWRPR